jgi:dienelactone hydrolase
MGNCRRTKDGSFAAGPANSCVPFEMDQLKTKKGSRMQILRWRERQFGLVLSVLFSLGAGWPAPSFAAVVQTVFDLRTPNGAPAPANRFAVAESRNLSAIRVSLPKTNCTARPSDCNDVDVLNTLDGFNVQGRIRVPFTGPINLYTVNSGTIFLMRIGDVSRAEASYPYRIINLNQFVWHPATNTLTAEPDELLEQHTKYCVIVTQGIRGTDSNPIRGDDFWTFINNPTAYRYGYSGLSAYRSELITAIEGSFIEPSRIMSASVFTTMSATAEVEKIRDQIKASLPGPANFMIGSGGSRAVFPLASVQNITVSRQIGTAPTFRPEQPLVPLLNVVPNAIGSIAFGRYGSPDYTNSEQYIPSVFTRTGSPVVQRVNSLYFMLILPASPKPSGGWPIAIYGHGLGSTRETLMAFASVMASRGIATIAISVYGHGGGPLGTLTVSRTTGTAVTLPVGGRGIDRNGDGVIGSSEGVTVHGPNNLIQFRDGARQTVVDMMQLVRVIETNGVDVDGDSATDFNRNRIYYFGISFGGMYGPILLAVDPAVRAGVPMVGGGTAVEISRLGLLRSIVAQALANRTPSLLNDPSAPLGFNENIPLRNLSVAATNTVPGAADIQDYLERWEWVGNSGEALAYAQHLRTQTLDGMAPKPVIIQMAKGDMTVPNPTNSSLVRAGNLIDRTTYYRHDLLAAANPTVPKNSHAFAGTFDVPAMQTIAIQAQTQMAVFFASDGATFIDPDGSGPLFETPIVELPETLNFLP